MAAALVAAAPAHAQGVDQTCQLGLTRFNPDTVNVAYCLGWKHIVLVGVDLYDSRYFYLPQDSTPAIDERSGVLVPSEFNTT